VRLLLVQADLPGMGRAERGCADRWHRYRGGVTDAPAARAVNLTKI
jgi:hypothetical protein